MSFLNFSRFSGSKKIETEINNEPETISAGTKIKIAVTFLMVGFAVYIAYWVQDSTDLKSDVLGANSSTQSATSQVSTAQMSEISIVDFHFEPDTLAVKKGTTVLWTNKDVVPHTVTGDNFSSEPLTPGQSFSYTFKTDGIYQYHCSFHPQMKGTVLVGLVESKKSATKDTTNILQDVTLKPAADATGTSLLPDTSFNSSALLNDGQTALNKEAGPYVKSAPAPASYLKNEKVPPKGKLPESGPEDFFYAALFLGILYWQGKKRFVTLKRNF